MQHILLVFIKSHNALGGVGVLGAVAAERYDSRVLIIYERALYCVAVFGRRKLGNLCYVVTLLIGGVQIVKSLVDFEAAVLERLFHIHNVLVVGSGTAGAASVNDICAVAAEKTYFTFACVEGERIVIVFQKHCAFL